MRKLCNKCLGCYEAEDGFYRHPQTADGFLGACKMCTLIRIHTYRVENIEKIRQYDRERGSHNKPGHFLEWKRKNPEKYRAHVILNNALKRGEIIKELCEVCGEIYVHGHHDDYSKPLDVNWLCPIHHSAIQSNTQG